MRWLLRKFEAWREARRMKRERETERMAREMLRDVTDGAIFMNNPSPESWVSQMFTDTQRNPHGISWWTWENGEMRHMSWEEVHGLHIEDAGRMDGHDFPRAWRKGISR